MRFSDLELNPIRQISSRIILTETYIINVVDVYNETCNNVDIFIDTSEILQY